MLKKLIVAMLTILLATASPLLAAKGYQTEYHKTRSNQSMINFSLGGYKVQDVQINGVNYSKIVYEGRTVTNKKGYAELPFINANVALPADRNVSLEIADAQYTDIKLNSPLVPSRGEIMRNQNPETIPYHIDPKSVVDTWYPAAQADMTEPFIFREVRGTNVYVYPFAYNAKTQTLRVYHSVQVRLTENQTAPVNPLRTGLKTPKLMNDIYNSMFINYNQDSRYANQVGEDGDLLVIYTARDAVAIEPYIAWKKEKGFKVTSQQVATGTNVKQIIKDAYTANPNLLYVQLVGDFADIKSDTFSASGNTTAPQDPMLGCVVGTDLYPELMIGRFSGNSAAHITTQVNKVIDYEKTPDMNSASNGWYKKALGIGSGEGSGNGDDGEADYVHMGNIKTGRLIPTTYTTVAEAYQDPAVTAASTPINAGLSLINYCGHGSEDSFVTTGYSSDNVNASTNGSKLPFVFSVACVNGAFNLGDCFAEAWLRKDGGGAVATLMSTINQPWVPPMKGQDYFNDILSGGFNYATGAGDGTSTTASDARTTFGSIALNGTVLMLAENVTQTETQETIKTWTTFGDASLQVRTDIPKALTVSNTAMMMSTPFTATITSGGTPVAGAWVCLSQNGNFFRAKTDASGNVSVPNTLLAGTAKLTITGFNTETKSQDITVAPQNGPYLTLESFSVGQNGTGTHATFGSTVKINLKLKNLGTAVSNSITVTASSQSEYIQSFSDNTENLTSLAANSSQDLANALTLTLKNNIPDQTPVAVSLVITDNSTKKSYNAELSLIVDAPAADYAVAITGGSAQPNSDRSLVYTVTNNGHADMTGIAVSLQQSTSLDLTISNSPQSIGNLAAGASVQVTFPVHFGNIANGAPAGFKLDLTANNEVTGTYTNSVTVGSLPALILDLDKKNSSAQAIKAAIDAVTGTNTTITTTLPSSMELYQRVFVCLGTYSSGYTSLPASVGTALKSFVDGAAAGERGVYLEGGDTWSYDSATDIHPYFGITKGTDGGTWSGAALTQTGLDSLAGMTFTYAGDNSFMDVFTVNTSVGKQVMKNSTQPTVVWNNTKRCVGSVFEFAGVPADKRNAYMKKLLNLVGPTLPVGSAIATESNMPTVNTLLQNYPNPFNPETTIQFFNKEAANVKLQIYNMKGEMVSTVVDSHIGQGLHSYSFKAYGLTSGVYIYKLQIGNQSMVKSMLLLK